MKDTLITAWGKARVKLCKVNAYLNMMVTPVDVLEEKAQNGENEYDEELLACDDAFTNRFSKKD